jgi:hypothetical protein
VEINDLLSLDEYVPFITQTYYNRRTPPGLSLDFPGWVVVEIILPALFPDGVGPACS